MRHRSKGIINMKDFDTYQTESRKTWGTVPMNHPIVYPTMGLVNEAGRLQKKIKNLQGSEQSNHRKGQTIVKNELGDVLWYLTQICTELGLTLEEVAETNITKLSSRKERDKLGRGDDNR